MCGEENISIYTKCIYKCVHEHELTKKTINIHEEEGYSTRIMSGGLATWPSHHLTLQALFRLPPLSTP